MKKRSTAIILIVLGLIGFVGLTFFSGGVSSQLASECKEIVNNRADSAGVEKLLKQCDYDKGFAMSMTANFVDSQTIAQSNRYEVLLSMLKWFFLGLGIVGALALLKKAK